jgi:hypothetical protein
LFCSPEAIDEAILTHFQLLDISEQSPTNVELRHTPWCRLLKKIPPPQRSGCIKDDDSDLQYATSELQICPQEIFYVVCEFLLCSRRIDAKALGDDLCYKLASQ